MLSTFKLKNGIQIAAYNLPSLRSVYVSTVSKSGAIVEKKQNNGVAHFMEHMLVQGTSSMPSAEAISSYIESMAGKYNASTGQFSINFEISLPATHISDAIKISSEIFFKPTFPEKALEKERRAIMEELRERSSSHIYSLARFFRKTRFVPGSPLRLDTGGLLSTVSKMSRQTLISYWERYFTPQTTYVIIVGKFEKRLFNSLLEAHFGTISQKKHPALPTLGKKHFTDKRFTFRQDIRLKSNYIYISFPSLTNEDDFDLQVGQELLHLILGRLRQSRLFRSLRYQKGLVYDVQSTGICVDGLGYSILSSEVSTKNLMRVVSEMFGILRDFVENGPTQQEIDFAREYLANQWLMSFDNPHLIADWLEDGLVWQKKVLMPEEMIGIVKKLTRKDLITLMKNYWDFRKLNLTIQGPDNLGRRKKELEKAALDLAGFK